MEMERVKVKIIELVYLDTIKAAINEFIIASGFILINVSLSACREDSHYSVTAVIIYDTNSERG